MLRSTGPVFPDAGSFFIFPVWYDGANVRCYMLAVVKFPSDREVEEMEDNVSEEVDMLFDYLDERTEQGGEPSEILMAMVIVVKMVANATGDIEMLH